MIAFLWKRAYALAMIPDGLLQFFGIRTGLALGVAKKLARHRGKKTVTNARAGDSS